MSMHEPVAAPRTVRPDQWRAYANPPWLKRDRDRVTVLYSYVERWKSYFFRAYFERQGLEYVDLGDHVKEDVTWGKEYGNRMECNPMYFTSGALIRNLVAIQEQTGLTKEQIVERYVFLGGGGQCGPCRYGMYPQEYLKVVNEAGFEGFRILIFGSDLGSDLPPGSAIQFDLEFRINILVATVLADLMHVSECALRPRALDRDELASVLSRVERMLFEAFRSRLWFVRLPRALARAGRLLDAVPRHDEPLPLIFITGEFFANLAHNDGNYNLRRFICDEGCEPIPGLMVQRMLYDNWRRTQEALRGIRYAADSSERTAHARSLRKQRNSTAIITWFYERYRKALRPERFGGRGELMDLDELARLGQDYYHSNIFGGEGNLEIGEALHHAGRVDGFITVKPFGCMPSSGVSDGVQAKVLSRHPDLNFLSIETSGDNEVSILSRVSMLLFLASQARERRAG
jgi:predicted nucleotide-binding protein (sugar kinase/HSP70/actin superfamily)